MYSVMLIEKLKAGQSTTIRLYEQILFKVFYFLQPATNRPAHLLNFNKLYSITKFDLYKQC